MKNASMQEQKNKKTKYKNHRKPGICWMYTPARQKYDMNLNVVRAFMLAMRSPSYDKCLG